MKINHVRMAYRGFRLKLQLIMDRLTQCIKMCFLILNREGRHASCEYIPRSSWLRLSWPGCPLQVQPGYVWLRRRHSPVQGLHHTPQSTASVCQSPALRRARKASPRWRCPAVSTGKIQTVKVYNCTNYTANTCSFIWLNSAVAPLHDEKLVMHLAVGLQLLIVVTD